MTFVTKDSGSRQEFETGSRRDTREGKGRFDLIPTMPLRRLAGLYERGAVKYGDYNWQKGQPLMRYVDSAMRHLNALVAGEPTEDHAIAVVWNMFSYVWTLDQIENALLPQSLDDRPVREPQYLHSGYVAAMSAYMTSQAPDVPSAFEAGNEHVSTIEDCPPAGAEGCGGPGSDCGKHDPVMGAC